MPKGFEFEHGPPDWYCAICNQSGWWDQPGFALIQDRLQDRLSIFHAEDVAGRNQVRYACSPAHARELVIHWMVTGSLAYPFAEVRPGCSAPFSVPLWEGNVGDRRPAVPIGELSVDRDAVERLLNENPAGLEAMLEELHEALARSVEEPLNGGSFADLPENLLPHI